jgi:formyl-CoA transferase
MARLQELREIFTGIIASRTTAEWCARFEQHDVPHAPVLSLDEVPEHPQVRANGVLVENEHPSAGRMRQALPAARFDATPTHPDRPAPTYGQHTDQVLGDLGYDGAEIAALRASGAVG